jgi:cellulose synthase/poly-beta-1,6-N-acetylglucosamine synthase-like glycosyltransferase
MVAKTAPKAGVEQLNEPKQPRRRVRGNGATPPYGSHDAGTFFHGGRYFGYVFALGMLGIYLILGIQLFHFIQADGRYIEVSIVIKWLLALLLLFYLMLMPYRLWLLASVLSKPLTNDGPQPTAQPASFAIPPKEVTSESEVTVDKYVIMIALYREDSITIERLIESLMRLRTNHSNFTFQAQPGKAEQTFTITIKSVEVLLLCEMSEPENPDESEPPHWSKEWPRLGQLARVFSTVFTGLSIFARPKPSSNTPSNIESTTSRRVKKVLDACTNIPQNFRFYRLDVPSPKYMPNILRKEPQTKPRALNYGLYHTWIPSEYHSLPHNISHGNYLKTEGDYLVIYDAEDRPEEDQLLKAAATFNDDKDLWCMQARLAYENLNDNWITSLFKADYGSWFDLLLDGLGRQNLVVPLGGTSNHFRLDKLKEIGGWDAFNVAEDSDLGVWLARGGHHIQVLDSTTWEQADPGLKQWIKQRSRWMKGYMQTFFVHTRNPVRLLNDLGWRRTFSFLLIIGGTMSFPILNPLFWILTSLYVFGIIGLMLGYEFMRIPLAFVYNIQFQWAVPWATGSFFISNVIYFVLLFMGHLRHQKPGYSKHIIWLWPLYSVMLTIATIKALVEFIYKPYHWEKSRHRFNA